MWIQSERTPAGLTAKLDAARRVLVRLARESPGAIGRTERDETAAAAILWAVARGNDLESAAGCREEMPVACLPGWKATGSGIVLERLRGQPELRGA